MNRGFLCASVTRRADLSAPFDVQSQPRSRWRSGDLVVGRVDASPGRCHPFEVTTGRRVEVLGGERLVGALGVRSATLEVVGSWQEILDDGAMQVLSGGGILGRATSVASSIGRLTPLRYEGHAMRDGRRLRVSDFAVSSTAAFQRPTVLVIGTSMSAGKTTAARVVIRRLVANGLRVAAAKVTGAARYGDALSMRDAGAWPALDFVDAGLPSTVCDPAEYRLGIGNLLGGLEEARPDVAVIEAGASPLEGYNVGIALEALRPRVRCIVLCASDPYAVAGVRQSFGLDPDLVAGFAASTTASVELVRRLTDLPALDLLDPANDARLDRLLADRLGRDEPRSA